MPTQKEGTLEKEIEPARLPRRQIALSDIVHYFPSGGTFHLVDRDSQMYVLGGQNVMTDLMRRWDRALANYRVFCEVHRPLFQDEGCLVMTSEQHLSLYIHEYGVGDCLVRITVEWLKKMRPVFQRVLNEVRKAPDVEHIYQADGKGGASPVLTATELRNG